MASYPTSSPKSIILFGIGLSLVMPSSVFNVEFPITSSLICPKSIHISELENKTSNFTTISR